MLDGENSINVRKTWYFKEVFQLTWTWVSVAFSCRRSGFQAAAVVPHRVVVGDWCKFWFLFVFHRHISLYTRRTLPSPSNHRLLKNENKTLAYTLRRMIVEINEYFCGSAESDWLGCWINITIDMAKPSL